jgi:RNA polymerase primary sigma factor
MEAELKPKVVEIFDSIADNYKKLSKLQDVNLDGKAGSSLTPSQERRLEGLKNDTIKAVKSLQLNNNRIEALVEQLYSTSTAIWCRWKAACCVWLKAMVLIAQSF